MEYEYYFSNALSLIINTIQYRGIIMSKKSSQGVRCLRFLDNLSSNSNLAYKQTIGKYEEFHNLSMQELIDEALMEQSDSNVPIHQLSVIDRIEEFQKYLINQDYVANTIKHHMTLIRAVYHKNRVELPYIESLNLKQCRQRDYIEYKDILTKDEIRCCLSHMRPPAVARAMVMAQGGLSNEECEHLTTRNFIDETYKYHQCDDDVDALKWLACPDHPIIWVTKLIRVKTGKPYYAIIGAEAINKVAEAKLYELGLPRNKSQIPEKLLSMSKQTFTHACTYTNKKCGLGQVAEQGKFRSHMLRKFHATNIRGSALTYEEHSRISNAEIDEMQGRGKTNVQDTYIKSNPLEQKLIYAKVMNNVSLYNEYTYEIIDDDVQIFLVDQLSENKKLKKQVDELERKLQKKNQASEKVKKLREELGNELFDEMIGEILNAS